MIPATLEMMDQLVIKAVEGSIKCGFPLDCATVLLIEVDGLKDDIDRQAQAITDICRQHGAREVRVAKNEAERAELWAGRRGAFGAVGRITPNYLVNDGTVPRTALPEALRKVAEMSEKYDLQIANVFHAGDGNLHPLILFDWRDTDQLARVMKAGIEIMEAASSWAARSAASTASASRRSTRCACSSVRGAGDVPCREAGLRSAWAAQPGQGGADAFALRGVRLGLRRRMMRSNCRLCTRSRWN